MRVLVTGLSGFTGHYVKEELERAGHEVIGLKSNLADKEAVSTEVQSVRPHFAIHLAAISFVPAGDSLDVYSVNTLGAQNLLDALVRLPYDFKKIVLASSSNIYGMQGGEIDESACPRPINHYGCSKLAMECIAETYMNKLPIVIARPFNYTGVGQSSNFLVPKIVSHFKARKSVIELGNIDSGRDFSDVRWIANVYLRLLEKGGAGEIYNLCSGRAVSIKDILYTLEEFTGHSPTVSINQQYIREIDIKVQIGKPDKVTKLLGESAQPDFVDTLRWMLQA